MKKPNVIVFFTDQQRADSTGVHGNPLDLTPNFDSLAREGAFFREACTCQPVCAPARSSVQTGLYATETGVWRNRKHLKDDEKTLAHHFNEAGYDTAYIGKWHLAGIPGSKDEWNQEPVPQHKQGGYEYWLGAELPEFTSDEYHTLVFDKEGNPVRLPGYRSDAYVDAGIRYISDRVNDDREKPFFLFLSIFEPHHQNHKDNFPAPKGYAQRYNGRWTPPDLAGSSEAAAKLGGYWGMIKRVDEGLGRLRDALYSMGISEDTIILYASDHGCHFKTRNGEYKRSCHESSVHIPCAAVGPGFNKRGVRGEMFSLVDLAPTIIDAAGLDVPGGMQGHSVMPSLKGDEPFPSGEQFIQISEDKVSRALRTGKWKYAITAMGMDGNAAPAADSYREEFLYDREADPWEQQNLIGVAQLEPVREVLRKKMIDAILYYEGCKVFIEPAETDGEEGQRRVLPGEEKL